MDQNVTSLAQTFCKEYYETLQKNKMGLVNFYNDASTMTYGGDTFFGLKQISEKIESFGFQKIAYEFFDMDIQYGPVQNSILIFITGKVTMDDSENFTFAQCFTVLPNNAGGYYCHNDVFRIITSLS